MFILLELLDTFPAETAFYPSVLVQQSLLGSEQLRAGHIFLVDRAFTGELINFLFIRLFPKITKFACALIMV